MTAWNATAFGLRLESSFSLPGMKPGAPADAPDVALDLASQAEAESAWSGSARPPLWETVFSKGCAFRVEAGDAGDHRMVYERRAVFHLSPDARTLRCAPARRADLSWQRELLDTVLFCTSVVHGYHLLHASTVQVRGNVVAFAAAMGSGKTSLAAALMRRGAALFSDDILALERRDGSIVSHPGPRVMCLPLEQGGAEGLGTTIGGLGVGDEAWIQVDHAADRPAPLRAIYLLERRADSVTCVERVPATSLQLMPHSVSLSRTPERYRDTFEFFGDLALRTPVYRLRAALTVPPEELAALVEASLPGLPGPVEALPDRLDAAAV